MAVMTADQERLIVCRVCEKLRDLRIEQGISQQRLSELAGLSRTGVRHIESLETNPTLHSLLKVSKALKTDFHAILAACSDG